MQCRTLHDRGQIRLHRDGLHFYDGGYIVDVGTGWRLWYQTSLLNCDCCTRRLSGAHYAPFPSEASLFPVCLWVYL